MITCKTCAYYDMCDYHRPCDDYYPVDEMSDEYIEELVESARDEYRLAWLDYIDYDYDY